MEGYEFVKRIKDMFKRKETTEDRCFYCDEKVTGDEYYGILCNIPTKKSKVFGLCKKCQRIKLEL